MGWMGIEERVTEREFLEAITSLEDAQPDVNLKVPAIHLFVLIGALQLAQRHPQMPPTSRKIVTDFITAVRDSFEEDHPKLAKLIDQGNDRRFDL